MARKTNGVYWKEAMRYLCKSDLAGANFLPQNIHGYIKNAPFLENIHMATLWRPFIHSCDKNMYLSKFQYGTICI
ncbi:hypothetical protein B5X24_HaOG211014 [Helicoverpa armigera]|nr:hypothetical protein B5X24_HaOG211014 [Helicoverpa armigera]